MKAFLIGDIHGRPELFQAALEKCGVEDLEIPAGVMVCQVGDLIHGGPDSLRCLETALSLKQRNPDSYIQILGNHELHYAGGPPLHGEGEGLSQEEQDTLHSLAQEAQMACWMESRTWGEVLVTHGGLTRGLWEEMGSPTSAKKASKLINALPLERAARPGRLVTGRIDPACGVAHARTGAELAQSWLGSQMPFSQLHGHEGVWWWPGEDFHSDVPEAVRQISTVDPERRRSWVQVGGEVLLSVDPKPEMSWDGVGFTPLAV